LKTVINRSFFVGNLFQMSFFYSNKVICRIKHKIDHYWHLVYLFTITEQQLENEEDIVQCHGCTLCIKVLFQIEEDDCSENNDS